MAVTGGPNNNTLLPVNVANISGLVIDNLVFYYDTGRTFSYAGNGSTWYDLSGNGRDVTLYNAGNSTYTNSPPGAPTYNSTTEKTVHFTFDGNDFGKFSQITSTTNRTFSAWVKLTDNTGRENGLLSHCNGGPVGEGYAVTTGKMRYWYYSSQWNIATGTTSVNDGNWKNLVWCKSGTAHEMYINGVLDHSTTLVANVNSLLVSVGSMWGPCYSDSSPPGNDFYTQTFNGSIAILMLHSIALTADQISQNFNRLRSRFGV
jgi:hypothetical protein